MHQQLAIYYHYLLNNYDLILAYLGTSGVISLLIQYAKKKLSVADKKKIIAALGALSVVPDAINTLASNPQWASFLPDNFSWLFTGSVALHAFLVSPVWKRAAVALRPYLQAVEQIKEQEHASASGISNPNLTLNANPVSQDQAVSTSSPQQQQSPEEVPLVIQG